MNYIEYGGKAGWWWYPMFVVAYVLILPFYLAVAAIDWMRGKSRVVEVGDDWDHWYDGPKGGTR